MSPQECVKKEHLLTTKVAKKSTKINSQLISNTKRRSLWCEYTKSQSSFSLNVDLMLVTEPSIMLI